MNEKEATELARSYARNCNILEHAAHKYLQNVDAKWQPHEWVVRAICAAYRRGAETAPPAFLVSDLAAALGTNASTVCVALIELGFPPRSTNTEVSAAEAVAVTKRLGRPA